ncbi:MAG: VOC family protein [Balneola sp.]
MKWISPYLFFQGNCEEAITFYKNCLGGELAVQRFGDTEMPVEESYKDKIMHAELTIGDLKIMFSDGAPHKEITSGDNIQLNLGFDDEEELEKVFKKLAEGGTITMPLEVTFWQAKFGMLVDKFGVRWMVNCSLKDPS